MADLGIATMIRIIRGIAEISSRGIMAIISVMAVAGETDVLNRWRLWRLSVRTASFPICENIL